MICQLITKEGNVVLVHGEPDIYLVNKDFYNLLRSPERVRAICDFFSEHYSKGILVGKLGELSNGVYVDSPDTVNIDMTDDRKELSFYESFE